MRFIAALLLLAGAVPGSLPVTTADAQNVWLRRSDDAATNGPAASLSIGYDRLSLEDGLAIDGQPTGTRVIMTGGAIEVSVAYGMFGLFAVVVEASGASVNAPGFSSGSLGHLDAGLQIYPISTNSGVTPFLHAGYGTRALIVRDDDFSDDASRQFELTSSGVVVGLGALNYFRPSMALRIQVSRVGGAMSSLRTVIEQPGDDESDTVRIDRTARSTRVNVGLVWYFLR